MSGDFILYQVSGRYEKIRSDIPYMDMVTKLIAAKSGEDVLAHMRATYPGFQLHSLEAQEVGRFEVLGYE